MSSTPSEPSSSDSVAAGGPGAAASSLADAMFAEVVTDGQSARTVADDVDAAGLRETLRGRAHEAGVHLRTARMKGLVLAARLDAAIWTDDTATMRAKLTPPTS